ncbi:MAG TPA: hypothetical protein VEI94_07860 [Candidatus Bathyarchaeia archaeon]|nr:hypothetical protein [Candidatus Bathyarchaeia archaeon]
MKVDVSCKKCGQSKRLEIGRPAAGQSLEEYLHLLGERLSHRPSFECFGGHFELRPPVPEFWDVRWETLGE